DAIIVPALESTIGPISSLQPRVKREVVTRTPTLALEHHARQPPIMNDGCQESPSPAFSASRRPGEHQCRLRRNIVARGSASRYWSSRFFGMYRLHSHRT